MQKTTVNPNPEQEMTVNPFAQEQTAEIQPQENAQTYPVEVDGDIDRADDRRADRRRSTGTFQAQRLHPPQPCGKRHAKRPDLRRIRRGISRCPSRGHSAAGMGVGAAGRLARVRVPQVGDCRTERRTGSARDEPEEPPFGGRSGAVGRGTHGGRPGYARFARQVTFAELKMENGKWKITAFILHYQLSIFHYCTI